MELFILCHLHCQAGFLPLARPGRPSQFDPGPLALQVSRGWQSGLAEVVCKAGVYQSWETLNLGNPRLYWWLRQSRIRVQCRRPGLGRSPGEENGYPLQNSGLKNSMDHVVHGVAKSQTQLNDSLSLSGFYHGLSANIHYLCPRERHHIRQYTSLSSALERNTTAISQDCSLYRYILEMIISNTSHQCLCS